MVINVASSTSQLRDSEIEMPALRKYVEVDLLAPVELVRGLVLSATGSYAARADDLLGTGLRE